MKKTIEGFFCSGKDPVLEAFESPASGNSPDNDADKDYLGYKSYFYAKKINYREF